MQPFGTFLNPARGNVQRVIAVNGFVIHASLTQTDTLSVFDIDSGN
jgi:hypothetical protein